MLADNILNAIPNLSDADFLAELSENSSIQNFHEGQVIIEKGSFINFVPIVIEGVLRILRVDEDGKEVFLYYLKAGDTCAISLTCCSTHKQSEIKAVADTDSTLLMIPVKYHDLWLNNFRVWKDFVALTYQQRFEEVLHVIDAIAFKKMDERLLNYLLAKFKQYHETEIHITHQEIATELGSSREVISRLLKQLEKRKIIELGRNVIYVRSDFDQLKF